MKNIYETWFQITSMGRILPKHELNQFLDEIGKERILIAPVKRSKDTIRFEEVSDFSIIDLSENPLFPPKKFFFEPLKEVFRFKNNKIIPKKEEIKERVIFGIRLCDINALLKMKLIFGQNSSFAKILEKTLVIGLACKKPEEHCFCDSMELKDDGYDLMFYDVGHGFHIEARTERGKNLVKHLKNHELTGWRRKKQTKVLKKLAVRRMPKFRDHAIWQEMAEKCLSCARCTLVCPTCFCFDMDDKMELNFNEGKRIIQWDSCQLKSFTRVAGDYVYRKERESRLKHRIYHKLDYFRKEHNEYMCVGCGRCIKACAAGIDMVEGVNSLYA